MKPILFNTEMVQAILEGRKTCTRRKIIRTPSNDEPCGYGFWKEFNENNGRWYIKDYTHSCCWLTQEEYTKKFAPYHIGDIIYVRETFFEGDILNSNEDIVHRDIVIYATDDLSEYGLEELKWKPSIYMPKRLARIFLKVKDMRIERLQDITEEGAKAEGATKKIWYQPYGTRAEINQKYVGDIKHHEPNYVTGFAGIWDRTLGKIGDWLYSFKENPYVWVIEFEKISKEEALRNE